jgi:pyridoxal phosphate enzyme (YggS family)
MEPPLHTLKARLEPLQKRMALAKRSRLAATHVTLLAAAKTVPPGPIEEAVSAGITHFGENRVQEALEKWPLLKARHPQVRLHLIGPLQTNKARDALALFDVIETLDREKLVDAIARIRGSENPRIRPPEHRIIGSSDSRILEFYVQVNIGEEPQKSGVSPAGADMLISYAKAKGLNVTGLMCVPPAGENPGPYFALLRSIAQRHALQQLSMGMSEDFETAIRFGATEVRIGSALFGERDV